MKVSPQGQGRKQLCKLIRYKMYSVLVHTVAFGLSLTFSFDPPPLLPCCFQEVPATWIPASGVDVVDGVPQPDKLGHTPGMFRCQKDG